MLTTGKYNQGPYSTTEAIALEADPEPSSFALAALGLMGLLAFTPTETSQVIFLTGRSRGDTFEALW